MTISSSSALGPAVDPVTQRNSLSAPSTSSVPDSAIAAPASSVSPPPSVIVTLSGATTAPPPIVYSPAPYTPPPVWQDASLAVKTASGRTLTLGLPGNGGDMVVEADGDAPLSDAETAAIGMLSKAFKSALDGMASAPPRLDLTGLAQLDPSVLRSVHLTAQASDSHQMVQTIEFTADATSRSVKIDGPAGKIDVSVDLSTPAFAGSKAQQASAIDNYLKQFDRAAARGHADRELMSVFKSAFTQMNAPAGADTPTLTRPVSWLSDTDHSLLSGLADFNASITQTPTASNPYRSDERDGFTFQVAQTTRMSGRDPSERSIAQTSSSQLHASYHSAIWADSPLHLTEDPRSQNYYFTQIDDSARSDMSIGYRKGKLVQAQLDRTASQNTEVSKFIMGRKVEDVTTPLHRTQQRDLLSMLTDMERHPPQTAKERDARTRDLATLHASVGLQSDPVGLA
ncbi:MAG TPA: hypothetical protein VM621_00450 [Luteibacter sp.]|uniref:hypothetical protein n=1 Tax=Luteibacter sp. TaxID=1886636 RepID=UPI002C58EAF5|nr:hypothetical protein [Luteibacter sp.]HVI53504.1 hypothetical protein [Luteibacter sp.]